MIIVFTNGKGGVGKTYVSVHMAGWIQMHGYSVVLVDCDAQQLSSRWMQTASPDLDVVKLGAEDEIRRELPRLAEQYELVVVDAPGGLSANTVAILSLADAAIIPTSGGHLDVQGSSWTIKTIQEIKKQRGDLPLTVVLPVKASPRHKTTRNLKNKAKRLGFGVTRTSIPHLQIYAQAAGLESEDGGSWDIPPSFIWDLGKGKKVREAALYLDAAFQEIFPEVSEEKPELVRQLVTPKKKFTEERGNANERKVAANV